MEIIGNNNQWVLGSTVMEVFDKYVYLRLEIGKEGVGGEKQKKPNEGKARKMVGMILNEGSMVINEFEVSKSL